MIFCICDLEFVVIFVWFQGWKTSERMPGKPETDECGVKHSEHVHLSSSIYSHQPWLLENASKSSSLQQLNGSIMNGVTNSEALVSPSGKAL